MKFQSKTACHTATTEEHSQRARTLHGKPPALSNCRDALLFANPAHETAQHCSGRELRVGARHGIAAQQEATWFAGREEAMQKQATVPQGEHDLAPPDVFGRTACDFDNIARPKSGQHAFPVNPQTRTTAGTQRLRH
jgi:hypothetical protein